MELTVEQRRNHIHPKKFALWLACASILMMFAAFSSAYIVREAAGNWLEFKLPSIFYVSTIVLLASSITIQASFQAFKKEKEQKYKRYLIISFVLGLVFLVLQYQGWLALNDIGVELTGNPSGSFVFVISGAHAAHILGGLTAFLLAIYHAYTLPFKVTGKRELRFNLTTFYWHFVDILWLYLLFFFVT